MDTYALFKAHQAQILMDRAIGITWEPSQEEPDEDLETLWDRLTDDEKADLRRWLEEQQRI